MHVFGKILLNLSVSARSVLFLFSDIDDCGSDSCMHGATCMDRVNSYSCECAQGYIGSRCETGMYLFHFVI